MVNVQPNLIKKSAKELKKKCKGATSSLLWWNLFNFGEQPRYSM